MTEAPRTAPTCTPYQRCPLLDNGAYHGFCTHHDGERTCGCNGRQAPQQHAPLDVLKHRALDAAVGAVVDFYNGVIEEKDAEIAALQADGERLAALLREARRGRS
ncbi:MAG: hypothetical protein JWN67_5000 [Actinomycetia bacterium]|nr:hypothetical protein [Actinomycetes bacterium]